ncbi:MAG TPA: prenyltransferase/squalene oxidase repeat-containing protein, partial [Desulfurivibrionaceae bacterium]|nr:prenyltransferase/squalene oxidase repeat-containing protein [Desulfurivibrionaceae bacterium]
KTGEIPQEGRMPRTVDYAKLVEFVAIRRKESGGYGATRRLPATVEDTYEAVGLLAAVADQASVPVAPANDAALADYLARVQAKPWLGLATTFQLLATCRRLGVAVDLARLRHYADSALTGSPGLETSYFVARLAQEVAGEEPAAWLGQNPDLTLPERRSVSQVRMLVAAKTLLGQPIGQAEPLVAWLRQSQNGDGGFGFFPGTTSFIENCHSALAALALLGAKPAEPEEARAFVVSCQTGRGGFARNPKAAPFLDASWHAIRSLALLDLLGG